MKQQNKNTRKGNKVNNWINIHNLLVMYHDCQHICEQEDLPKYLFRNVPAFFELTYCEKGMCQHFMGHIAMLLEEEFGLTVEQAQKEYNKYDSDGLHFDFKSELERRW